MKYVGDENIDFFQSCHDTKDKLQKEVVEYRMLMEELEKWVAGIKLMLLTDLHKNNAEEQVKVHQVSIIKFNYNC